MVLPAEIRINSCPMTVPLFPRAYTTTRFHPPRLKTSSMATAPSRVPSEIPNQMPCGPRPSAPESPQQRGNSTNHIAPILTHMGEEMLESVGGLEIDVAEDGKVIQV